MNAWQARDGAGTITLQNAAFLTEPPNSQMVGNWESTKPFVSAALQPSLKSGADSAGSFNSMAYMHKGFYDSVWQIAADLSVVETSAAVSFRRLT